MVDGPIWPKFELFLDIMYVLDTYKFKMDRIISNREKVATSIFLRSRAAVQIWPNFNLIQALMYVISTYKYKKDRIKNILEKVAEPFFPLKLYGNYLLPWKPEFGFDLTQNVMQPFPNPNDASDKI